MSSFLDQSRNSAFRILLIAQLVVLSAMGTGPVRAQDLDRDTARVILQNNLPQLNYGIELGCSAFEARYNSLRLDPEEIRNYLLADIENGFPRHSRVQDIPFKGRNYPMAGGFYGDELRHWAYAMRHDFGTLHVVEKEFRGRYQYDACWEPNPEMLAFELSKSWIVPVAVAAPLEVTGIRTMGPGHAMVRYVVGLFPLPGIELDSRLALRSPGGKTVRMADFPQTRQATLAHGDDGWRLMN